MAGKRTKKRDKNNNQREDPKGKFKKRRKKVCVFCAGQGPLEYRDQGAFRKFITDRGKIAPRRMSGCCAKHQRMVAKAVKKARHAAILPHVSE